jgi:23S rRNA (cytidine2498-2'-O)-methyltransferase
MADGSKFLFATCQVGAEAALKAEVARRWADFRLAFSRPGFLTFKQPAEPPLAPDFDLQSIFARAYGFSLGKTSAGDLASRAEEVWQIYGDRPVRRVHVWLRDVAPAGEHGYSPEITPEAREAAQAIVAHCPRPDLLASTAGDLNVAAQPGEFVLDCVLVEPDQWWIGQHRALSIPSRWAGGMIPLVLPDHAVSRAWLKMEEALRWSELPIPSEARCAEIGSAPGGASQALLSRGLYVLGIDPAEMAPAVLEHPRFTHLRRRANQVRRRDLRKVRWLTADMNVAPSYTLDVVEEVVTHPEINIRGMLLTLKLFDWTLADHIPEYLRRIRSWGYNLVRARQLQHNRQEICVSVLQKPFRRKTMGGH